MFNLVQHSNKAFKFKQRLDFKRYTFFTHPWGQHSNNAFKFQQRLDFKRYTFFGTLCILELMTRSQQRPSWLSWQSVALNLWGREFDSHRRPCMELHFSQLVSVESSKIYTLAKYPYRLPLLVYIECVPPMYPI